MKNFILKQIAVIILLFSISHIEAKNYSYKAERPAASNHNWSGYDYNFNLDENGDLTGTNVFSIVYNTTPPKWKNSGYYGEGIRMYTGHETLTIDVLPGDMNFKYTFNSQIVEWQWDTHILKWVKRKDMPTNGTRTVLIKNGVASGAFEIPVVATQFIVTFLCSNSINGIVPDGQTITWKSYNATTSNVTKEIESEGNSTRLNLATFLEDVDKRDISRNTGLCKFGQDESGCYVDIAFPYITEQYQSPLLITVANKTGVGSKLTKYAAITLPDFYYDKYVNPYDPVTKILDNGHKLVSTLQENQSIYTEETWEEDGYSFLKKYDGEYHPTIGKKIVGDTTYIKYKDLHSYGKSADEKGFIVQKKYYLTNLRIQNKDLSIDYSHVPTDGYIIIDDNNGKHFAYIKNEDNKPYLTNYEVESIGTDSSVKYNVYKHIDNDGNITVPIDLTSELSTKAIEFKNFLNHPYVKIQWPSKTKITELTMTPDGELLPSQKDGYYEYILRMSRNPNNPMYQLQASIAMELNLPDYNLIITKKIDEKVVGQRTAKLLKELPKSFITHLKDEKQMDLKKARVSRIIKQDKNISVYVTTIDKNGNENITKLMLEDNIPVDKYAKLWKLVTKNTK